VMPDPIDPIKDALLIAQALRRATNVRKEMRPILQSA
jgi:hypothetical protein